MVIKIKWRRGSNYFLKLLSISKFLKMVVATLHSEAWEAVAVQLCRVSCSVFSLQCRGTRVKGGSAGVEHHFTKARGHITPPAAPGCQQHVKAWAVMVRAWGVLWRAAPSRGCRDSVGFYFLYGSGRPNSAIDYRPMLVESNENWVCGDRERQKSVNTLVPQSLIISLSFTA